MFGTLLHDKKVSIDTEKCMKCALCARVCPMQLSPYTDYDDKCQLRSDDCIRCGIQGSYRKGRRSYT